MPSGVHVGEVKVMGLATATSESEPELWMYHDTPIRTDVQTNCMRIIARFVINRRKTRSKLLFLDASF